MAYVDKQRQKEHHAAYYQANKEKIRIKARINWRNWRQKHKEELAEKLKSRIKNDEVFRQKRINWSKRWRLNNPEKMAESKKKSLLKSYGLTWEQYQDMVNSTGSCCYICGKLTTFENSHNGLNVDHDHVTKKVRGLLCSNCNTSIGLANDNPVLLRKMIKYLKKYATS